MLWSPTISKTGFRSIIRETDETSTGKWLVPIMLPDIGMIWDDIQNAALEGKLSAVKKSTPRLQKKIGHDLVCVYCPCSVVETVTDTLAVLREIGVDGELRYKSDRATFEDREEFLYRSSDLEGPTLKLF